MDTDREADPELPQLPPPPHTPQPPSSTIARLGKPAPPRLKKIPSLHDTILAGTSSDPPAFSSDDVPADSENYASHRKKKSRLGPWWETSQPPRKKRRMEHLGRNLDSGVFMDKDSDLASSDIPSSELDVQLMSDATAADDDLTTQSHPVMSTAEFEAAVVDGAESYTRWGPPKDLVSSFYCPEEAGTTQSEPSQPDELVPDVKINGEQSEQKDLGPLDTRRPSRRFRLRLSPRDPKSSLYRPALEVVERAVENGVEDIDLTGQCVWQDLPLNTSDDRPSRLEDQIFHPLHHLVKTRSSFADPDRFDSLVPDMRLWLSANGLQDLPNEIYRLRNLTKLGLRGNQLKTLSPSIASLERLQYLNLSGNPVAFLPWEITKLPNLTELLHNSAHFLQPFVGKSVYATMPELLPVHSVLRREWSLFAVSLISWLDPSGIPINKSPPRPSSCTSFDPTSHNQHRTEPPPEAPLRVPSLVDTALRTAAASPNLPSLLSSEDAELIPQHLVSLLKSSLDAEHAGGLTCSVCSRRFVVPRAEWLEWTWPPGSSDLVPLLRTACSWGCAVDHHARLAKEQEQHEQHQSQYPQERSKSASSSLLSPRSRSPIRPLIRRCGWERPTGLSSVQANSSSNGTPKAN